MVLREEALAERIALLRSTVLKLRAKAGSDLDDEWDEWALERGLLLAAQALFDIGNHVLTGAFAVRPREYSGIAQELATRGVISPDLAHRLTGLAGFRNLLVHEYVAVDARRVRELLRTRLDDFSDFANAVDEWLQGHARD